MKSKNKSVIYWKWEDATLESDLAAKVEDLCSRMDAGSVFVGLHWVQRDFWDEKLQEAVALCARELHKRGRRLHVECCPRNEAAAFFQAHPEDVAYVTTATEIALNKDGRGSALTDTTPIPHYWRTARQQPALLRAFLLDKTGPRTYASGSAEGADGCVTLSPADDNRTLVAVDGGPGAAGRTAVVFVGIPQPIPDLASDAFADFYAAMLTPLKKAEADGVMSDEWGYDVIIRIEDESTDPDYYKKREIYFEHVTYTDNFARRYRRFCNRELRDDLLRFYYEEEGGRALCIRCVNAYHEAFRDIMRGNDEAMYALSKKILGPDTFYGVHPTWWGNNYLQNFEGFKNAFYWWEAKRDVAQTDEIVIMPIRTALAHKWGGDTWYNMWYSMGTRDIGTYYRETWNNVRFGGRTHYLAYECPNEAVVLELKPQGLLESIEEMDAEVRLLDSRQNAMPDCRVLVLFGMQNALNWYYNDNPAPPWYPRHKILSAVLETADRLFDDILCDLVPTSEIENGSLFVDGGRVRYGSQDYDAVILLAPDSLAPACFPFLQKLDASRFIVAGEAREYSDGTPLSPESLAVLEGGVRLNSLDCADQIKALLAEWEISANRFEQGCVLQDGSLIFTADGEKAVHNPLSVHIEHRGLRVDFEGEDLLFLQHEKGTYIPVYPRGDCRLDGVAQRNDAQQKGMV